MKRISLILLLSASCGCMSQFDKELKAMFGAARLIGDHALVETVSSDMAEHPPGYPQTDWGWNLTFSNSTHYVSWLLQNRCPYTNRTENPFCVTLDLPLYIRHAQPPEGGSPERVREEHLIHMPLLFTRNLEIDRRDGHWNYVVTTNWPFGERGVAIHTYYGESIFLKGSEVQEYFEQIPFTNAVLRP